MQSTTCDFLFPDGFSVPIEHGAEIMNGSVIVRSGSSGAGISVSLHAPQGIQVISGDFMAGWSGSSGRTGSATLWLGAYWSACGGTPGELFYAFGRAFSLGWQARTVSPA